MRYTCVSHDYLERTLQWINSLRSCREAKRKNSIKHTDICQGQSPSMFHAEVLLLSYTVKFWCKEPSQNT